MIPLPPRQDQQRLPQSSAAQFSSIPNQAKSPIRPEALYICRGDMVDGIGDVVAGEVGGKVGFGIGFSLSRREGERWC
jgi:hypothetical protein